jgi:hypothetical protein
MAESPMVTVLSGVSALYLPTLDFVIKQVNRRRREFCGKEPITSPPGR